MNHKKDAAEIGVVTDALATPYKVISRANIKSGETVAVFGAGGGLGYATLKYHGKDTSATATISGDTETYDSIATEYNHSTIGYGIFAVFDAGWQGKENYYFQFAMN